MYGIILYPMIPGWGSTSIHQTSSTIHMTSNALTTSNPHIKRNQFAGHVGVILGPHMIEKTLRYVGIVSHERQTLNLQAETMESGGVNAWDGINRNYKE